MAIGIAALFSVFAALAAYALAPRSGMHRLFWPAAYAALGCRRSLYRSFLSLGYRRSKMVGGFDHGAGHPLLYLDDAKAPNCRKNNGFKGLGNYSEWPKVAGAVIEARWPM